MTVLKSEVSGLKEDVAVLKSEVSGLKAEVTVVKQDMAEVKKEVSELRLHIENVTDRNIQILAENHLNLIDKLNQAIKVSDHNLLYELKVNTLTRRVDIMDNDIVRLKCMAK